MDQQNWHDHAEQMADRMERILLDAHHEDTKASEINQAVSLAHDYLHYLGQPARAISFVRAFHRRAERRADWWSWSPALEIALRASVEYGSIADQIALLNALSQAARELNEYTQATEYGTRALDLARQHADPALLANTYNKLGILALRQGQLIEARNHFEQALNADPEQLTALERGHFALNLGTVSVQLKDYSTAEQRFREALKHYTAAGASLPIARVQFNLVDLRQRQGQLTTMPPELLAARDLFKAQQALYDYALAENAIGYVHYRLHESTEASAAYDRAFEMFHTLGSLSRKTMVLTNQVALAIDQQIARANDQQDWSEAERLIAQGYQLAESCNNPLLIATLKYDHGRMFVAQDRISEARAVWQEALALYRANMLETDAAQLELLLASLDGDGDLARHAP